MTATETTICGIPLNGKLEDLKRIIAILEVETVLMRKLSTRKGFYEYYFDLLKCSKTKYQAFYKVNRLYYKLFGKKRYDNFSIFSKMVKL